MTSNKAKIFILLMTVLLAVLTYGIKCYPPLKNCLVETKQLDLHCKTYYNVSTAQLVPSSGQVDPTFSTVSVLSTTTPGGGLTVLIRLSHKPACSSNAPLSSSIFNSKFLLLTSPYFQTNL